MYYTLYSIVIAAPKFVLCRALPQKKNRLPLWRATSLCSVHIISYTSPLLATSSVQRMLRIRLLSSELVVIVDIRRAVVARLQGQQIKQRAWNPGSIECCHLVSKYNVCSSVRQLHSYTFIFLTLLLLLLLLLLVLLLLGYFC